MVPAWLSILAWVSLGCAFASAAWLSVEQIRRPPKMWIMGIVWPVTALYMGPVAIWAYYSMGLRSKDEKTFPQIVFTGVTHCGAGCTLGDIWSEFMLFYTGFAFAGDLFKSYLVMDYILAYMLGIIFQYFTIAPMRGISGFKGIWAAVKADTLSLTAFEAGLFGWMAIAHFFIFRPDVKPDQATYWFMMQIGMCLGFGTAFPMNWRLIKRGLKEPM